MPLDKLQEKLKESKIEGGDLVPSLAQRLREEGREQGERVGVKKGMEKGEKKKAKETARRMLTDDLPIENIAKYTGLTEKEVKELLH